MATHVRAGRLARIGTLVFLAATSLAFAQSPPPSPQKPAKAAAPAGVKEVQPPLIDRANRGGQHVPTTAENRWPFKKEVPSPLWVDPNCLGAPIKFLSAGARGRLSWGSFLSRFNSTIQRLYVELNP